MEQISSYIYLVSYLVIIAIACMCVQIKIFIKMIKKVCWT